VLHPLSWERGLSSSPYGTSPPNREVKRFQTLPLSWERGPTTPFQFQRTSVPVGASYRLAELVHSFVEGLNVGFNNFSNQIFDFIRFVTCEPIKRTRKHDSANWF